MFGLAISPDGRVHQTRMVYAVGGRGPFPAHRFWIDWAGVWSEWFHMPFSGTTPW